MNSFYLNFSVKKQKNSRKYRYLSEKKDFNLSIRSTTNNKSLKIISHKNNRKNNSYKEKEKIKQIIEKIYRIKEKI